MLNLCPSKHLKASGASWEMAAALALGLLAGVLGVYTEEQMASNVGLTNQSQKAQGLAALQQPVTSTLEVADSKRELKEGVERLNFLIRHESEHDDLSEAQDLLRKPQIGGNASIVKVQTLRWQSGRLEFEGVASSPEALHMMQQKMGEFSRWQTGPSLVQIYTDPLALPGTFRQNVGFKLQGSLQIAAETAPLQGRGP